ncbi:MAG: signal peptidase I [Cryobacterium sp.]|uniref:signal peptidase I n=1 Tax=unclassified Cryobacterium TaxID=2649013 RepID=UPI0018CB0BD9|nr:MULTISPECIES: signal peptidase I [unclassified Cryobacterium]MCY7405379.1 signal peptidase I [Cryobacterium sp.]MEC5152883.1 signal peptidase I [Cryobacterium sp. CAN_C3]
MTDDVLASRSDRRVSESKNSRSRKAPSKKRSVLLFSRDLLIIFVVALLISFLIKTFLIRSFYIPSGSMENTLQIDDRIIVNQLEPELIPITRGDVIVFKDPGGWLLPQADIVQNPIVAGADWLLSVVGLSAPDSNDHLIKRVIGLPGDHVVCCNVLGQMSVNDIPLDESAYVLLPAGETKVSGIDFDVTIPAESLWMMGDNRYNSKDSRFNGETVGKGYVPIENVVGRALVVSWPLAHWAWLDDYPNVFREVEQADKGAE